MVNKKIKFALIAITIMILVLGLISNASVVKKAQITGVVKAGIDEITRNSVSGKNINELQEKPATDSKEQRNQKTQDNLNKPLSCILEEKGITNLSIGLKIVIDKSEHTLTLLYNGTPLKSYDVELGSGGTGDKEVEGDKKTPEGTFYITNRKIMDPADYYLGSRWLGVSYPNTEDAIRGLGKGLINQEAYSEIVNAVKNGENPPQYTALGGNIGIHGGSVSNFGRDWTWGCVGLKSSDIEDFYNYIGSGTPITIQK